MSPKCRFLSAGFQDEPTTFKRLKLIPINQISSHSLQSHEIPIFLEAYDAEVIADCYD